VITQRDEILAELARRGWRATSLDGHALDWWADEMWLLESEWSPRGREAYLIFLVDPMADPHVRKKGEQVWAAAVTARKPLERMEASSGFVVSLKGWEEDLPGMFEYLSALRGGG
jgi:hypothetical protein